MSSPHSYSMHVLLLGHCYYVGAFLASIVGLTSALQSLHSNWQFSMSLVILSAITWHTMVRLVSLDCAADFIYTRIDTFYMSSNDSHVQVLRFLLFQASIAKSLSFASFISIGSNLFRFALLPM